MEEFVGNQPAKIAIIGAGGQGREVLQLILDINRNNKRPVWSVIGFYDDNVALHGQLIHGYRVNGGTDSIPSDICVIIAIGNSVVRKRISEKVNNIVPGVHYVSLIHPSAVIGQTVTVGQGVIIAANCTVMCDVKIGDHSLINYNSSIGHDSILEEFSTILPGCNISGNVTIKRCSEVGSAASVIPGITVGEGAKIGAGAAVVRDIPSFCTAVGVPASPIKFHKT
ncbi:acetyltransferase [Gorillibacterium sp. sgz5001074]|uniref:acetyltransferase n=1 Tax=Gorillibacterium sp. sgz5001074 TaxID=3446695 RepID=UPI003F67EE57